MSSIATKILFFCTADDRRMQLYRLMIVCFVGVLTYSNTFRMSFNFDDAANILSNPLIKEFNLAGVKQALYSRRAFGIFTFQFNYHFSGGEVFGYHLTNLLIHLAAAFMVYTFLTQIMKTPYWVGNADNNLALIPVPFFSALLFVSHPIQTQAVTYIVQRYASLASLLYLAALVCYLQARLLQNNKDRLFSVGIFALYMTAAISAVLAFFTKEIAYTLPVAVVMVELFFIRFSWKKLLGLTLVFGSFSLPVLFKYGLGKGSLEHFFYAMDEATRLQTLTSRGDYLLTQFRVIVTYLRLIFLPVNQSVDYDLSLSHSFIEPRVICSFILLAFLIILAIWLTIKSKASNAHLRIVAFGLFWFFLTLSIESSLLPIIDLIFEHRVYLPSVGIFAAVSTTGLCFAWRSKQILRKETVCICLLLVTVVFAGVAWKRNFVWTSEVTLWEDATLKKPKNARAWNNLGGAYIKQKESVKALHALIRSIELDPSKAAAWNNLGIAIDLMGVYKDRFYKTKEMFVDPKQIENKVVSRWLGDVNNNLGLAYEIVGNLPKAAENYRNAIGYYPALGIAYFNLGLVSAAMGDYDKYVEQQQVLWLIDPALAERLKNRVGSK